MRRGKYADRPVKCPNATTFGYGKRIAKRGDVIVWEYSNDLRCVGRMLGRVNADADGPNVPAVKGWIAVLMLTETLDHAFVRWVNPAWVQEVRNAPTAFPAWFFGALPSTEKILAADSYGSLDEHYIERAQKEGRL